MSVDVLVREIIALGELESEPPVSVEIFLHADGWEVVLLDDYLNETVARGPTLAAALAQLKDLIHARDAANWREDESSVRGEP